VLAGDRAQRQELIVDCGEFGQRHERHRQFCHAGTLPEFWLDAEM
jgi:hypothetical protein